MTFSDIDRVERVMVTFGEAHPEFNPTPKNWTTLGQWLDQEGLPVTVSNLERAYEAVGEAITPAATPAAAPRPAAPAPAKPASQQPAAPPPSLVRINEDLVIDGPGFVDSTHNAVFKDGTVLPVLIRTSDGCRAVKYRGQLAIVDSVPGFERLEIKPEYAPKPPEEPKFTKIAGHTYKEQVADATRQAAAAMAERQAARRAQLEESGPVESSFARAARLQRNEMAENRRKIRGQ